MGYVANVAVEMEFKEPNDPSWVIIKKVQSITYQWRLVNRNIIQVAAGVFDSFSEALATARQMYVKLLMEILDTDNYIHYAGCEYIDSRHSSKESSDEDKEKEKYLIKATSTENIREGICVLEIEKSMSEIDKHQLMHIPVEVENRTSAHIGFNDIDRPPFTYSDKVAQCLGFLVRANKAIIFNERMAHYCSLLEFLATDYLTKEERKRPGEVHEIIRQLIEEVDNSALNENEKKSLTNVLRGAVSIGATNEVRKIVQKFGQQEYHGTKSVDIINNAYSARSQYDHHGILVTDRVQECAAMKDLVYDVMAKCLSQP